MLIIYNIIISSIIDEGNDDDEDDGDTETTFSVEYAKSGKSAVSIYTVIDYLVSIAFRMKDLPHLLYM